MADSPQLPLSVEDAKRNLRDAADDLSVTGYIKRHPFQSLTLAFAAGMLLANDERLQALLVSSRVLDLLAPRTGKALRLLR